MEPELYIRQCPEHGTELHAVTPVRDYPREALDELWCAPELHCEEGNHMVGVACAVDHWLVVHKPTGLVCYEADENGARWVDGHVLWVEPGDLEPRPIRMEAPDWRLHDPANWLRSNRRVAGGQR